MPARSMQRVDCRARPRCPSMRPVTPLPVTDSNPRPSRASAALVRRRARSPPRADARCPPRALRPGAAPRLARSPARCRQPISAGLPSVSVPVLSTTSVSTAASARAPRRCLTSTPACAPRPVATMMDIGVARPSAQGQAMISTVTAATRACASWGAGPSRYQTTKASDRDQRSPPARNSRRRCRPAPGSARAMRCA